MHGKLRMRVRVKSEVTVSIHIDDVESSVDVIPEANPGAHMARDRPDLDALLREHESLRRLALLLALRTSSRGYDD